MISEAAAFPPLLQEPCWEVGKSHCVWRLPHAQQGRDEQRPPCHLTREGLTAAPQPPRHRPAQPGETPKGSLNTIYKYYGLSARASLPRRPPIGHRNLAEGLSRIAQPGGDLAGTPLPPGGRAGCGARRQGQSGGFLGAAAASGVS